LRHITRGDAPRHLRFRHSAKNFRSAVVRGERRGGPFLSTEDREGGTVINVHGDGGSRGKPQPRGAGRAGRTVLSTVTTNDYPTILAARREMQSWKRLALEPTALRAPDGFADPKSLDTDGRHLASTLYRIASENAKDVSTLGAEAVYARVAGRLSDLSGVSVDGLVVELDQVREVFTLFLQERGNLRLPARALSEGTLRFLALCVLLEDPNFRGLICMEEPENGIHPANLPAILQLVRDLAVDPSEAPDNGNIFRQVIVNTHAPGVVQLCDPQDLLLAEVRPHRTSDGEVTRGLTLLPFKGSWRTVGVDGLTFSEADVVAYLASPAGAQLRLPLDLVK
jgi:predicted ATPase